MAANYDDAAVRDRVEQALDELFTQVLAWGGVITGEHGIGLAKEALVARGDERRGARACTRGLKQALDPLDILNPGKFVGLEVDRRRMSCYCPRLHSHAHFRSADRILVVRPVSGSIAGALLSMKPGTFTHTIAVLLSSVSAVVAPSAPAQVPTAKFKLSKKQNRLNEDVLLKVDPIGYTPPTSRFDPQEGRRAFPVEEGHRHDGFLDRRKSEREQPSAKSRQQLGRGLGEKLRRLR